MTTRQKDALKRQAAHGANLREWLQDRAAAARKRQAERNEATTSTTSTGRDRVPARYRDSREAVEVIEIPPRDRDRSLHGKARRLARKRNRKPVGADVIGVDMDGVAKKGGAA